MSDSPNEEKSQIKSRERVASHGEVFTAAREVKAMCDLVKDETERIDSRFLEPACGDGNFLAEILTRKLAVVRTQYAKNVADYEKYSLVAVSSLYGIDIMADNAASCRKRLFVLWQDEYAAVCKGKITEAEMADCEKSVVFILERNILCGNALSFREVDKNQTDTDRAIVFSEWSLVGSQMKRRDFAFNSLVNQDFSHEEGSLFSDLGDEAEIFSPVREFPLVSFRRVYEQSV